MKPADAVDNRKPEPGAERKPAAESAGSVSGAPDKQPQEWAVDYVASLYSRSGPFKRIADAHNAALAAAYDKGRADSRTLSK